MIRRIIRRLTKRGAGPTHELHLSESPVLEGLEPRVLLSASLKGGLLTVIGSDGDDVLGFAAGPNAGQVILTGDPDGDSGTFDNVTRIKVQSGSGNDQVTIDVNVVNARNAPIAAQIDGGAGNDVLTSGDGNDKILSGGGNDTIDARNGNNKITTIDGDDDITSGTGNDKVKAGDGNNTITDGGGTNKIRAGTGNDIITNGAGNDNVKAGDGTNTITDAGGTNKITTGSGNDAITTAGGDDKVKAGATTPSPTPAGPTTSRPARAMTPSLPRAATTK